MKTKKEIKKSFFAVIKALWEKPKADVFYIQNYAWDWVEEAIEEALKQQKKEMVEEIDKYSEEKHPGEVLINKRCSCCGTTISNILNLIRNINYEKTKKDK